MSEVGLKERIIFALDFPETAKAISWVEKLDKHINFFKVGLQLFLAGGWNIVDRIVNRGNKVMLDLKFFDIPETVGLAVSQLHDRGVTFATVHGNTPIIESAVSAKGEVKILAVTVLTSFDNKDMEEMGSVKSVQDLVLIRARKALSLGCDGIVSSPLEVLAMRKNYGSNFFVVTPGIRPGLNRDVEKDDQRRVATAKEAMINGADHVVIGRPISTSPDPLYTVGVIQREISEGLELIKR